MRFAIEFHGGFRVATGNARANVDDTVDSEDPLPGSALKGLMRAAARTLLPGTATVDHPLVASVFGGPRGRECPWNWDRAIPSTAVAVHTRAHVRVDEGGAAARDMLHFGEEVWVNAAQFEIIQCGPVDEPSRHELLLACAAQAVHSLGSDRRRGLGWVTVHSLDRTVTASDVTELIALRTKETVAPQAGGQ